MSVSAANMTLIHRIDATRCRISLGGLFRLADV
jgi:hypothetical protein